MRSSSYAISRDWTTSDSCSTTTTSNRTSCTSVPSFAEVKCDARSFETRRARSRGSRSTGPRVLRRTWSFRSSTATDCAHWSATSQRQSSRTASTSNTSRRPRRRVRSRSTWHSPAGWIGFRIVKRWSIWRASCGRRFAPTIPDGG